MVKLRLLDVVPESKLCGDCKILKSTDKFNKRRGRPRESCKECHAAYTRRYNKMAYEKDKDYYYWCKMKQLYGLTPETWNKIYESQNGLCALCKLPERTGAHRKLNVDHCHETGRVRGLLCNLCNSSLGILGDNPERIKLVLDYVSR